MKAQIPTGKALNIYYVGASVGCMFQSVRLCCYCPFDVVPFDQAPLVDWLSSLGYICRDDLPYCERVMVFV